MQLQAHLEEVVQQLHHILKGVAEDAAHVAKHILLHHMHLIELTS